jgi:DnaJ-class molecular chaperone
METETMILPGDIQRDITRYQDAIEAMAWSAKYSSSERQSEKLLAQIEAARAVQVALRTYTNLLADQDRAEEAEREAARLRVAELTAQSCPSCKGTGKQVSPSWDKRTKSYCDLGVRITCVACDGAGTLRIEQPAEAA